MHQARKHAKQLSRTSQDVPRGVVSVPIALFLVSLFAVLAACGGPITPDQAELANIRRSHLVPKSSPNQMIRAFDRFCINGPADPAQADVQLRAASYVPVPARQRGTRAYVVDDKRPAVARSARMCMVQVKARTGQADKMQRYIAKNFPDAQPLDPAPLGRGIEQAWRVPGPGLIATRRAMDADWHIYTLLLYRERA